MPDIERIQGPKGWLIWSVEVELEEGHRSYALGVLAADSFHFARYGQPVDNREAIEQTLKGFDPLDTLGADAHAVFLDAIVRVTKLPGDDHLFITYREGNKDYVDAVNCPDELGGEIFQALRQRLKPRLRFAKERLDPVAAAMGPFCCLMICWFFLFLLFLGALAAASPPAPGPRFESSRVAAMRGIGGLFGPAGVLALGGLVTVGHLVWGVVAILRRPMERVLRADSGYREQPGSDARPPSDSRWRKWQLHNRARLRSQSSPSTVNGIGTSMIPVYGLARLMRWGRRRPDCDAVESFVFLYIPFVPLRVVHTYAWSDPETIEGCEEVITQYSYASIPLRCSAAVIARAFLPWWLGIAFGLGFLLAVSCIMPIGVRLFGCLLALGCLAVGVGCYLLDSRYRDIHLLLGRHRFGSSDPATWTDEMLRELASPEDWFGTPTFADAVGPLLRMGYFAEALWAARLSVVLEDRLRGEELTSRILQDPRVRKVLPLLRWGKARRAEILESRRSGRPPMLRETEPLEQPGSQEQDSVPVVVRVGLGLALLFALLGMVMILVVAGNLQPRGPVVTADAPSYAFTRMTILPKCAADSM